MLTGLIRVTLASTALVALAGCTTVGSDFTAPAVTVAGQAGPRSAWRGHGAAGAADARLPRQWWSVFGDATLDRLEGDALGGNPGVAAAAQRLLQAEAQLGVSRAYQSPTLGVSASAANSRTSANTSQGVALGRRSISGDGYALGASMSYELDLLGRVRRMVEAADAQVQLAESERDGVLLMLSAQVATTYWQLRGLDAEAAILGDALATRRETQQLVEARLNAGLSNELDAARARVEHANAEADLHEVRRQRALLEHALATLTGRAPAELQLSAAPTALPAPPVIPAGLPASLLARRPDLAGSVAALRAANAQVGVAEGAFYPSLQLTGNFGYASESLHNLAGGASRQFSIGPLALSLPLFDGGRNRANLALAQARYAEARANHEGRLQTALREVEDALSDLEQRQRQGEAQARARQAAARAYLVARVRYERGISNYLDVTDAQRSALAAERATAQIDTQRLLATVALARALGAGWQPAS